MPLPCLRRIRKIAPARIYLHADKVTGAGVLQIKEFEFFQVDGPNLKVALPD